MLALPPPPGINGLEDLLMELDPDTWCNAMQMQWTVEDVVRGWEDFG